MHLSLSSPRLDSIGKVGVREKVVSLEAQTRTNEAIVTVLTDLKKKLL